MALNIIVNDGGELIEFTPVDIARFWSNVAVRGKMDCAILRSGDIP